MFRYDVDLYESQAVHDIRRAIYHADGYYILRNFVDKAVIRDMNARWFSGDYNYYFTDGLKNREVRIGTPNYLLKRPAEHDWAFCNQIWNQPIDEIANDIVVEAQRFRNLIEGRPLNFGTRLFDSLILQYRICRTLSNCQAVNPHADFMEEFRHDSMGDHQFDPRRCQMTLFLSNYGEDYSEGGFRMTSNQGKKILFGQDEEIGAGDLLIWKYSNLHDVGGVQAHNKKLGFARIIFPSFDKEFVNEPA